MSLEMKPSRWLKKLNDKALKKAEAKTKREVGVAVSRFQTLPKWMRDEMRLGHGSITRANIENTYTSRFVKTYQVLSRGVLFNKVRIFSFECKTVDELKKAVMPVYK